MGRLQNRPFWKPVAWQKSGVLCCNYKLEEFAIQIPGIAQLAQTGVEICVEGHLVSKLFSDFIPHLPIHLQHDHFLRDYPLARRQPLQAVHGN